MFSPVYDSYPVHGAGLGLRRTHLGPLLDRIPPQLGFMEIAPEGWLDLGGRLGNALRQIAGQVPVAAHGLLLNLGGPDPLDTDYLAALKHFLAEHHVPVFSDHMTYCGDEGLLYELLPVPFTRAAARHMADRIRQVQDILEQPIAVENASYYVAPGQEIAEIDFLGEVLERADCGLLLDVNNIVVNSINHGYDAAGFLRQLPGERICYAHIAGHLRVNDTLAVDTHGAAVCDGVWELLDTAYAHFGPFPTLLERDENIPDLEDCLAEVDRIVALQVRHGAPALAAEPVGG